MSPPSPILKISKQHYFKTLWTFSVYILFYFQFNIIIYQQLNSYIRVLLRQGTLPFKDGTFDIVFANSVFSHLEPDLNLAWMKEIHRTLQPGGLAMLTIIDPAKFVRMAAGAKEWMEKLDEEIQQTQKNYEFKIQEMKQNDDSQFNFLKKVWQMTGKGFTEF